MAANILVIEDDPASLDLMTYLLGAHGYQPLAACRGDDGLAMARGLRPDLILCDIQLPGIDGYVIVRLLKADDSLRAIPVVAVTAMAMVGDRERVLLAGFDSYVSKPIDPSTFVAQIEPLLGPKQRAALPVQPAAQQVAKVASPHRGTILVVDDLTVNLDLKRSIFEPLGYRVLTAGSAAAGLQTAREYSPDLIIADVGLPDATGLQFLQWLKADAQLRKIPVVTITSTHAEPAVRDEALLLGAERFLIRPMDPQQLLREIESCLAQPRGDWRGSHTGR
jgi:two-component system cell cycle response regulator